MLALLAVLLVGCSGSQPSDSNPDTESPTDTDDSPSGNEDSPADDDSPADSPAGPDTDTDPGSCDPMSSGNDWAWSGQCPGMVTPCDITVDGCAVTIDYSADGGMTMGMPYSATISGSTVTFADDNTKSGCVGTLDDPDTITGTCDGGCTFTLSR